MGDYYVDDMLEIFSGSGCMFGLNQINQGWERRSRSSGGFDAAPIGIQWHHTASKASIESDLNYMINGSPDRPVGNVLLDRNGIFWPVAAGAANTSGKGGPNTFSRGVCPLDKGNTKLFSIEIANNGVGEPYSAEQIDAAFCGSNALNANFGNQPDDVVTHALGSGDGYTSRKIDPATTNVFGEWEPRSVNSSGTWSLADLKAECLLRAGTLPGPGPIPIPPSEDDMPAALLLQSSDGSEDQQSAVFWWDGKQIGWVHNGIQIDVGVLTGLYQGVPSFRNFNVDMLQGMIDSSWAGGPIPAGFSPPSAVDSSVT